MSKLSKEQQAEIEENLKRQVHTVFLRCDGYLVQAGLSQMTQTRLSIEVFVNGWVKGEWFNYKEPSEEEKRFYRPSQRALYTTKEIKLLEKIYGKRECRKKGVYDKTTLYMPNWLRPKPFIRHLIKHNESIEVLDYEAYELALEQVNKTEESHEQTN